MKRTWLRVQLRPGSKRELGNSDRVIAAECLKNDDGTSELATVRRVQLTDHDGALTVTATEAKV
jgi:hypothetical protein